jgi:hypothetical protein
MVMMIMMCVTRETVETENKFLFKLQVIFLKPNRCNFSRLTNDVTGHWALDECSVTAFSVMDLQGTVSSGIRVKRLPRTM